MLGVDVTLGGIPWSREEEDLLIKLNNEGKNYTEISKLLKTRSCVSCGLKGRKLGLISNNNVDVDFFSRDNEESHYILGYWLADGCIMKKSGGHYFSVVSKDVEHLENMSNIMNVKTKLYKNSNNAYELRVGNKQLVDNLIEIGGTYRKTKTIELHDLEFNTKYFRHLLRGYFDGDGNYQLSSHTKRNDKKSISAIKFTGSSQLINSIYLYLGIKGSIYVDERKSDCVYLCYYGDEMRNLLDYMYEDSEIYLQRKYDTYEMYKYQ